MSIEELVRTTFADHAEQLVDPDLGSRGERARSQARGIQRRRQLGTTVAVCAAAALAVAGMLGANPFERPDAVEQPDRLVDVPASFAGRTLVDSAETRDGQELSLTVTADGGSQWMLTCAGVGPGYELHHELDGEAGPVEPCQEAPTFGDTTSIRFPAASPAGTRTVRLWISEAGGDEPVEPTGAVLSAAVFALPAPIVELAGTDVLPLEQSLGVDWAIVTYAESAPGERSVSLEVDQPSQTMLELIGSGTGDALVRAFVDGQPVWGDPPERPLAHTNLGDLLAPGAHTITLRIVGDVPDDARLAIVQRGRA